LVNGNPERKKSPALELGNYAGPRIPKTPEKVGKKEPVDGSAKKCSPAGRSRSERGLFKKQKLTSGKKAG